MRLEAKVVYKRINLIKKELSETDNVNAITEALRLEGIDVSKKTIERDIAGIYRGDYPDPWLDNFLNVIYPEMFKKCIKEIEEAKDRLKGYGDIDTNSARIAIAATTNHARINMDLINLIHKGPSVKMMRNLKVKADKLARALDEERKITEKLN